MRKKTVDTIPILIRDTYEITVAYVMYQKYVNSIPLYRHLLERDIIHADETPCQVLKEEGKTAQSKSYMWLYGSGNDGLPPIRLYDYQPSRGGYHAEEFLKGFSRFLTCDGFGGYNKLKDVIRCGCLAHMRRYWHDALPGKSKKSSDKTPAEIGLDYCSQLFQLEKEYADLDADTRKTRRLETEPAIWEAYWSWLETVNPAGGNRLAKTFRFDPIPLLYHVRPWHQLFYTFGLIFVVRYIEQYSLQICVDVQTIWFCGFY